MIAKTAYTHCGRLFKIAHLQTGRWGTSTLCLEPTSPMLLGASYRVPIPPSDGNDGCSKVLPRLGPLSYTPSGRSGHLSFPHFSAGAEPGFPTTDAATQRDIGALLIGRLRRWRFVSRGGRLRRLQAGGVGPIVQLRRHVGQPGSPEQVVLLLTRRKPRSFCFDLSR